MKRDSIAYKTEANFQLKSHKTESCLDSKLLEQKSGKRLLFKPFNLLISYTTYSIDESALSVQFATQMQVTADAPHLHADCLYVLHQPCITLIHFRCAMT